MVGVTALLGGYLLNQFFPDTFSSTYNSPLFMYLFCIVFALGVAYIAYRGVTGTTAVNMAINIIQITALLVFSVIAIAYRTTPARLDRLPPLQRRRRQLRRRPGGREGRQGQARARARRRRQAHGRQGRQTGLQDGRIPSTRTAPRRRPTRTASRSPIRSSPRRSP
jgi:hypothetical protein